MTAPIAAGPLDRRVGDRVPHWLCGTVPFHSCGNCTRSYGNDSAVGIRLGCWKDHHRPTFLLPHDGEKCMDFDAVNQATPNVEFSGTAKRSFDGSAGTQGSAAAGQDKGE